MRLFAAICVSFLLLVSCNNIAVPEFYNLHFEQEIGETGIPYGWSYNNTGGYNFKLADGRKGKALRIYCERPVLSQMKDRDSVPFGNFHATLSLAHLQGKELELKAIIKTKAVTRHAGIWVEAFSANDSLLLSADSYADPVRGTKEWQEVSLHMQLPEGVDRIHFGGQLAGKGTAWFDDFEIRIDNRKVKDNAHAAHPPTQEELDWLRQYVYPLKTTLPESPLDDLEPLGELIGNKQFVGLGNITIGSGEIYQMRSRIVRYLTEKKGFDMLAFDASRPEAEYINTYIQTGERDSETLIRYTEQWSLKTQEVHEMIKQMREQCLSGHCTHVSGFGFNSVGGAFMEWITTFKNDKDISIIRDSLQNELIKYFYTRPPESDMKETQIKIYEYMDVLSATISEYPGMNKQQIDQLNRNLHLLKQSAEFFNKHNTEFYNPLYSFYLADNFLWLNEQYPNEKKIIWTSNNQVKKTGTAMGHLIANELGDNYLSIGFAFHTGTYYASGHLGNTSYKAQVSYPGTYEYYLQALNEPILIVDLRKAREDKSHAGKWLSHALFFRSVDHIKMTTEFERTSLTDDYDLLIFVNESTASKRFRW